MPRPDRPNDQLRAITVTRNYTSAPAGSVLWKQGGTVILATASITPKVPDWFGQTRSGGWITADYVMLPGSTPQRKDWPRTGHTDSRGTEITRLVGRSLRAAVDLARLGPHTLAVDCTVLQADGGTRTAAISAGYLAIEDALAKLPATLPNPERPNPAIVKSIADYSPKAALLQQIAAVSVGLIDDEARLDLDYLDDSAADIDLNVVMTGSGRYIEIQGTSEQPAGLPHARLLELLSLAHGGIQSLLQIQRNAR
jgi:ribonuclease PH